VWGPYWDNNLKSMWSGSQSLSSVKDTIWKYKLLLIARADMHTSGLFGNCFRALITSHLVLICILWSFQLLPVRLIPPLCVFVLVVLLQRDHKVLRSYIIQRVVQSLHPPLLKGVLLSSTMKRPKRPIQLVLLPLWVHLYVIVPAAQQLQHLTCCVSMRIEGNQFIAKIC